MSIKKAVFVVEGQTEQIFLLEFINHLVALTACHVELQKYHGNVITIVTSRGPNEEQATHSILIINVENDEKTLSFIEDNIEGFKKKNIQGIFGLRDRYTGDRKKNPVNPEKIDNRMNLLSLTHGMRIELTVAIEEIEAWFLSVPSFFEKFDKTLTLEMASRAAQIDLATANVETVVHPASIIDRVLKSVGLRYRKRLDDSHKIAAVLDYDTLYLERAPIISPLGRLVDQLTWSLN